jgi:hypothetical protein
VIPVAAEKEPKLCTVAGCDPLGKRSRFDAVIWCPKCGEARCEKHRHDLPTRSCCTNIVVFERRP